MLGRTPLRPAWRPRLRRGLALGGARGDSGSAIIEFVFVAVIVMIPLVYLIVAVAVVQRSELAVSQAAREAGRAFATSDSAADVNRRVPAAVRLALESQHLGDDATVRFVAAGSSCDGAPIVPRLQAGAQFTVCVTRRVVVPAVPSILAGHGITTVGEFVVHVDDYRAVAAK
jgi:Flp pilus assembly protein TadG